MICILDSANSFSDPIITSLIKKLSVYPLTNQNTKHYPWSQNQDRNAALSRFQATAHLIGSCPSATDPVERRNRSQNAVFSIYKDQKVTCRVPSQRQIK
jgi:hypothetical protein